MRRVFHIGLALLLLLPSVIGLAPAQAQGPSNAEVEALLRQMGTEHRVGQLFLVTFNGTDVGPESDIAELITTYRIGGVVLHAANDNFTSETDLLAQTYQLTTNIQTLAEAGRPSNASDTAPVAGPYIPLFIGVEHEGGGSPNLQLWSGVTPLASNMAVGATWNPANAFATGEITGRDLSALGINLLIGPPADVAEEPQVGTTGDLGTRVFGGEPFWVTQMTSAYVQGVHAGSGNRVAVVPIHFPGQGGADRSASEEVPTVRRTLDKLNQIDLQPYTAVTGLAADRASRAEGLMTAHIQYLGFQGTNPRLPTSPISVDAQALSTLLALPGIAPWRQSGGLLVSDSLGLGGIRRFYDAQEQGTSNPQLNRLIAYDAFLAGNDVLYLGDFGGSSSADQMQAITDTIGFFVQQYNADDTFRARVDEAVRRILSVKLDLYEGDFSIGSVLPASDALEQVGNDPDVTTRIAQESLTLLFPDAPSAPRRGERIVIFTDARTIQQCSTCTPQPIVPVDALRSSILRQYGPETTGLVSFADIQAFSFEQLERYIEFGVSTATSTGTDTPVPDELAIALNSADWVVFAMLDITDDVPSSRAIKDFLRTPLAEDNQIIVVAFGAPYYLDQTEVSKLTAYYALYGSSRPFVDVAASAIIQGLPGRGASPVSVRSLGYDILTETSPDPVQAIPLTHSIQLAPGSERPTLEPEATIQPEVGDTVLLTAGPILDHNGNIVPDGTPVDFVFKYTAEAVSAEELRDIQSVTTTDGYAQTSFVITSTVEITVVSLPAETSNVLTLGPGVFENATPTPQLPTATVAPTETPAATPDTALTPTQTSGIGDPPLRPRVDFGDLFFALFGLTAIALAVFVYGLNGRDINYGLLLALPTVMFGLIGYNYFVLQLPGTPSWRTIMDETWGAALATWIGGLIGLALAVFTLYAWGRWVKVPLRRRRHYR